MGAVTGNPRIRTRSTLIGRIQVGEFSSIIGLIKRTQRVYGQVFTVSGVVAAFRRTALDRVGYWSLDMITEDIDISWKLQRDHWSIFYEPRGLCWILMPETLRGLWKQRLRWAQGGAEVFLKNLRSIWNWRHRRLWPLMAEFCLSTAWSFAFAISVLLWLVSQVVALPNNMHIASLLPPAFTGMMLAVVCLLQFAVSILIDRRYERAGALALLGHLVSAGLLDGEPAHHAGELSQGHAAQAGPPRALDQSRSRHQIQGGIMIITTRRSRAGYLFDLLLTAGGWFAFVCSAPASSPSCAGPPAAEISLWAVFLPTANTLWGYAALALANGAALVAWALYNHRRFAGRTAAAGRPSATPSWRAASPSRPRSCSSCAARVAVIHHGDGGEIIGIEPARAQLRSVA